jgi:osmotically-inducible protein OsmY
VNSPFEAKHSDEYIAKRALDFFRWDTLVPSDAIQVTVVDGWLTLTGNVDWFYQKTIAEEDVQKLDGVTGVSNQIKVRPHPQAGDIKRMIEAAFTRQVDIDANAIRVTVKRTGLSWKAKL